MALTLSPSHLMDILSSILYHNTIWNSNGSYSEMNLVHDNEAYCRHQE